MFVENESKIQEALKADLGRPTWEGLYYDILLPLTYPFIICPPSFMNMPSLSLSLSLWYCCDSVNRLTQQQRNWSYNCKSWGMGSSREAGLQSAYVPQRQPNLQRALWCCSCNWYLELPYNGTPLTLIQLIKTLNAYTSLCFLHFLMTAINGACAGSHSRRQLRYIKAL